MRPTQAKHHVLTLSFLLASAEVLAQTAAVTTKAEAGTDTQSISQAANKADAKPATPALPRPIEIADMAAWKGISSAVLSADGLWAAWRLTEADGDANIVVKSLSGKEEFSFPAGQGVGTIEFSEDG